MYQRVSEFRGGFALFCKCMIPGPEIKNFKELPPFLVSGTEIVVFHAGEEDLEMIQACRRR